MQATDKLRGWVRASTRHAERTQVKRLEAWGCEVIYSADKHSLDAFVAALRKPRPGWPGDVVLVTSLARLARTRQELARVMAAIHDKGATILEAVEPPRSTDDAGQRQQMIFDAVDELAGDRRTHSPEAAAKHGRLGGTAKAAAVAASRTSVAEAKAAWRDLSITASQALATPAMDGWSTRAAYRELGKRNTARGAKIGRPRKIKV